jgi:hypothetical protein
MSLQHQERTNAYDNHNYDYDDYNLHHVQNVHDLSYQITLLGREVSVAFAFSFRGLKPPIPRAPQARGEAGMKNIDGMQRGHTHTLLDRVKNLAWGVSTMVAGSFIVAVLNRTEMMDRAVAVSLSWLTGLIALAIGLALIFANTAHGSTQSMSN